ncbi:MAG: hypothetical protein GY796_18515 [Chloroflexi bacterium]|nr:hypothetical protein [Chloroflexota bacterium]
MSIELSGYKIQEKLYESKRSVVYRGLSNGGNRAVILKILQPTQAIVAGLIIPLTENYKLAVFDVPQNSEYCFAHDRIQQAAYALIPENEKPILHHTIGQHLQQTAAAPSPDIPIFTIVNHLNLGQSQLTTVAKRQNLAALNLETGQKALQSVAYQPALDYLQQGIHLLPNDAWENQYDLALNLYNTAVLAAFLTGNYEEMERLAAMILTHGRTLLDQITAYDTKTQAYTHQNLLNEAIDAALPLLKKLGVNLPRHPNRRHLLSAILKTRLLLRGHTQESILNITTDQNKARQILLNLLSNAAKFTVIIHSPKVPGTYKRVCYSSRLGNEVPGT